MNVIVLGVCFDGACHNVVEAVVVGPKTPNIQAPYIPLGMTISDPLRHRLANAAGAGKTVRTERARHPESLHGGRTKEEPAVGCEALGSVEELDGLRAFH